MESDHPALAPGTRFGRYRIESLLGAGAMGAVYLATHIGLDKRVVVKVLHPEHARSSTVRMRFFREGRAAAAIRHPHVVDVTDVGEHDGVGYLVMEHLDGETLGSLIAHHGALPLDRAVDLLLPIIAAVDAAHAAGIVHRDLKPENLFVARTATGEPLPKVLDFGISRVVHDTGRRTGTAALLGTPAYMAPEQIASTRDADARSDQYALGVILYECVTGRPAFRGDNVYAVLKVVGDGTFDRPSKHRADLPAAFEAVILRAMAHDPAARYPTLHDLARALLPFASERSRVTWGVVFDPGGTRGPSPSVPPLDAAPLPPRTDVGHIGDTLVDAAQVRDTSAIPLERRRSRAPALIAALAVAGLVSAAAAFTLSRPSTPAPVPHPLTTALTRPDAATPPPTVVQPAPPAATPASLAAAPVQAAPPPRIRQPQGVRRPRRAVRSMTDILNTAP